MTVFDDFKAYLKSEFGQEDLLTEAEIGQLLWSARAEITLDATFQIKDHQGFEECRRAASRLFNMNLLISSDPDAYWHFTRAYWERVNNKLLDTTYTPVLEKFEFEDLKKRFNQFDPLMKATLRVSTLISSVPLSPSAREGADRVLGKNEYPEDSVEFLATTFDDIEKAKQIYPLVKALFDAYPDKTAQQRITTYLQSAFSHRRQYLQMLDTEGNANMFRELSLAVQEGKISPEQYNFWVCHWTINMTEFLTHNTHRAMTALESTLQLLFKDKPPSCDDLLEIYLEKRMSFLITPPDVHQNPFVKQLDNPFPPLDIKEKRLLAHIASMMRLFHPDEGEVLEFGLRCIPKTVMKDLMSAYFDATNPDELTPMHASTFFQNAFDYRREQYGKEVLLNQIDKSEISKKVKLTAERLKWLLGITDIIVGYLPLYLEILKEYKKQIKEGKLSTSQALSFLEAASKNDITNVFGNSPILKPFDVLTHYKPSIDAFGKIKIERILPPIHFFSKKEDGTHSLPEDVKWRLGPGNVLVTKSSDKEKDEAILKNAIENINVIISKYVQSSEPIREIILTSQYGKGITVVTDELLNVTFLPRDSTGRIVIEGDGLFCMQDEILLLNKSGDAHAIVFESHKAIGIAVGSWRCVKKGILSQMMDHFLTNDINPKDITIRIGPGIGAQSYDLGEAEYIELMKENERFAEAFVKKAKKTNTNNAAPTNKPQKYVLNFAKLIEIFAEGYSKPGATMKVISDESCDTFARPEYKTIRNDAREKKNPQILMQYYAHREHYGARLYKKVHEKTVEISKANNQPIPEWLPDAMTYNDTGRNLNGVYRPKFKK